jgi:RNA polymerase sigma-70 factor, ECF subfamily
VRGDDLQRRADEIGLIAAARGGDQQAFAVLTARYRRQLQAHCYRMLGSFDDAEDLAQETFLRAWRGLPGFSMEGRWSFRAWLYRIGTNACLNALARNPRRLLPWQLGPPGDPSGRLQPASELPWLQPYPDDLLEGVAASADEPEAVLVVSAMPATQRGVRPPPPMVWRPHRAAARLVGPAAIHDHPIPRRRRRSAGDRR